MDDHGQSHHFRRLSQSLFDHCLCSEIKLCATFTATSGCCHCLSLRDKTTTLEPRRPACSSLASHQPNTATLMLGLCAHAAARQQIKHRHQLALGGARMNTLSDRLGPLLSADLTVPRSRFSSRRAPDSFPLGAVVVGLVEHGTHKTIGDVTRRLAGAHILELGQNAHKHEANVGGSGPFSPS